MQTSQIATPGGLPGQEAEGGDLGEFGVKFAHNRDLNIRKRTF
jgi:hypothetical protein